MTLAVQGYDYLQRHGHDLSQYLLKIQLKLYDDISCGLGLR